MSKIEIMGVEFDAAGMADLIAFIRLRSIKKVKSVRDIWDFMEELAARAENNRFTCRKISLQKQDSESYPYIDAEGCSWKDVVGYIETGVFGFCGCGVPGYVTLEIYQALKYYATPHMERNTDEFAKENIVWLYLLDKEGFTKHGSTVYGGWLEERGKKLLALMEAHAAELELEGSSNE